MFRKEPSPVPEPCPFHPAPFTFTYNRGSHDCVYPPSRAESCTDDSRLLLRYMACPDVPSTESNVEELVCLASWKEGSTRYLVGQISQVQRRNSIASDEDTYRCFIYKAQHGDKSMSYIIAQSGDATCNGLSSPSDGSRTMKLTTTGSWNITNGSASITHTKKRLVCHSILEQKEKKHIKLVAHVTRGCESGHVCLTFHRRGSSVLELQQGRLWETPQDACSDHQIPPYITLITTSLTPTRCPLIGRYSIINSLADKRRRRQQINIDESVNGEGTSLCAVGGDVGEDETVSVGCGNAQDTIEFKSTCTSTVYTCYGSWQEGGRGFLIAAPQ
ncbi:unnamed protein product [Leptidea sinapis]|uniref:Uncharacterized protein n=1 Tax=Leptidea sinapis TaxID=189913 RepID=A0A5E4PS05_9NEOP|nr:unnamed protein product [Leptidea sinapis]